MPQVPPPAARRRTAPIAAGLVVAAVAAVPAAAHAAPPAAPGDAAVVRLVPETRGRGKAQRLVTRIDVFSSDGVRRRVRTIGGGGLYAEPALSPDGTRVAIARADGRIAVVRLGDGALRSLRPPGLPAPRTPDEIRRVDRTRWAVVDGAAASWSPDGRVVVAHGLVQRVPARWAGTLGETRSVACVVASGRCTTAGAGAPADLLPLAGGRTLRLDGPVPDEERDSSSSYGIDSARDRRLVLARRRDGVRTSASVARSPAGTGRRTVLRTTRSSARTGIVALGSRATGPAGVLVRRASVTLGPDRSATGVPSDGPSIAVRTRVLSPWVVSPAGRLSVLPIRLGSTPIGSLADGRWLLPSADARPSGNLGSPEPGLATLDRRGRVRELRVGGRSVTPVRLALEAGLPDTFAAGAGFVAAWPAGEDLLVALQDNGSDGRVFFPGDGALIRLHLDGTGPPRLVDHEEGASYDVR